GAVGARPALRSRAEQVAAGISEQAFEHRLGTVSAVKADQGNGSTVIAAGGLGDLEHRAVAIRPARDVVPNRSPWRSAIRLPYGAAPLVPSKLTRVVGVLA